VRAISVSTGRTPQEWLAEADAVQREDAGTSTVAITTPPRRRCPTCRRRQHPAQWQDERFRDPHHRLTDRIAETVGAGPLQQQARQNHEQRQRQQRFDTMKMIALMSTGDWIRSVAMRPARGRLRRGFERAAPTLARRPASSSTRTPPRSCRRGR